MGVLGDHYDAGHTLSHSAFDGGVLMPVVGCWPKPVEEGFTIYCGLCGLRMRPLELPGHFREAGCVRCGVCWVRIDEEWIEKAMIPSRLELLLNPSNEE